MAFYGVLIPINLINFLMEVRKQHLLARMAQYPCTVTQSIIQRFFHQRIVSYNQSQLQQVASAQELIKYTGQPSLDPGAEVSLCEVLVVVMGTIATAVAIAERDDPSISGPNHRQPLVEVMGHWAFP